MKTKLPLLVALAAAMTSSGAIIAQDQPAPQSPPPADAPSQPSTPPEPNHAATPPPPQAPEERRGPDDRREGRRGERDRDREQDRDFKRDRERDRNERRDGDRAGADDRRLRGPGRRGDRIGEPQPYLGVMTSPLPPPLSAQLGLEEGFGLLVQEVLPNSPAATAGLQKYDILKQFNDQQLVEPGQLAALVRAAGKDSQASLTIIRKGQEQKLNITVGERMQPIRRRFEGGPMGAAPMLDPHAGPGEIQRFHERMRQFHNRMQEWNQRQMQQHQNHRNPAQVPSADILKEARPGGGARITVFNSDRVTKLDGSKARLILKDQDGEIEVSAENGKRTLTAKNANGDVVFSGPVNTKEERQAVPEQFRSKLEKIEVRQEFDAQTGRAEAFAGASIGEEAFDEDDIQ